MKKKLFFILFFALFFVLFIASTNVNAALKYDDDINYTINSDGTVSVQAATLSITRLVIPSTINGKTVTTIASGRF